MNIKICYDCGIEKSEEDFYYASPRKTSRYRNCKKCYNKKRKNYGYAEGTSTAEYQRRVYKELKTKIFNQLGNKCANCGYDENPIAFDLDHINNDGIILRMTPSGKTKKGSSISDLKKILKNDCQGLQILCGTCHHIKTRTNNAETGLYKL